MENILIGVNANKKTARVAGLFYLILAVTSGFGWMYITKIYTADDAAATAGNIISSSGIYLLSVLFNITGQISFIFLALFLYRLFKKVSEIHSKLMLIIVLVSVPIQFINIFFQAGALVVLNRADYLKTFTPEQILTIAAMLLNLYIVGVHIVTIFWGLWLFPFVYLIYKSNFIPKIIAVLIFISGVSYLIGCFTYAVLPDVSKVISNYLSIPEALGELAIMFWLIIAGVRNSHEHINA